jgi:biopolymer transport protein ExbB
MKDMLAAVRESGLDTGLLARGGAAIWVIGALSVILLALILWKTWRLAVTGAFSRSRAERALVLWQSGSTAQALALVQAGRGLCARMLSVAFASILDMPEDRARAETGRIAKRQIARTRSGLRAIELIALISPLLGLLGTVLGMIAAFQQLQEVGGAADPATLAGGIWEALLTTAAGMAVAIPASIALTWFEGISDRLRLDLEDMATRAFTFAPDPDRALARAAE